MTLREEFCAGQKVRWLRFKAYPPRVAFIANGDSDPMRVCDSPRCTPVE